MLRRPLSIALFLVLALTGLLAVQSASAGHAKARKLYARTGPEMQIRLTNYSWARIKRLHAGTYTIVVQDLSTSQNFHLVGPGLEKKTKVRFLGTKMWKLRLKSGTYRYFSDAHPKKMRGSFVVR